MSNKPTFMRGNNKMRPAGTDGFPTGVQRQVNVNDLPQLVCLCGGVMFADCFQLRFASRLLSPDGRPTFVRVPNGFACLQCGAQNTYQRRPGLEEILPKEEPKAEQEFPEEEVVASKEE